MFKLKVYYLIPIFFLILILMFSFLLPKLYFYVNNPIKKYFSVNTNDKLEKLWPEIKKEHDLIKDLEIFKITRDKHGEEFFINNFLKEYHEVKSKGFRDDYSNKIKNPDYKINWDKYSKLFKSLEDLQSFDHIDFMTAVLNDKLEAIGPEDIFHAKMPILGIMDFCRLRLIHGIETNEVEKAIKELRHFAKLLYSSEEDLLARIAIVILITENTYRDKYNLVELEKTYPRIPHDKLEIATSYIKKINLVTDFRLKDEWFEKVKELYTGVCHSLNYSSEIVATNKNHFKSNYSQKYQRLKKAISDNSHLCSLSTGKYFILNDNDLNYDFKKLQGFFTFKWYHKFLFKEKDFKHSESIKDNSLFSIINSVDYNSDL